MRLYRGWRHGVSRSVAGYAPRLSPVVAHETRASANNMIVCGHWSTREGNLAPNLLMLDSGCLWGGTLTASGSKIAACFRCRAASGSAQSHSNSRLRFARQFTPVTRAPHRRHRCACTASRRCPIKRQTDCIRDLADVRRRIGALTLAIDIANRDRLHVSGPTTIGCRSELWNRRSCAPSLVVPERSQ